MKNLKNITQKIVLISISLFFLISIFGFSFQYRKLLRSEFLQTLIEKFEFYNSSYPEERVYLQLDKTLYEPNETIWFSAYIVNANDLNKSTISGLLNVELINPQGTIIKNLKIIAINGKANGDFTLSSDAMGGIYKIKAYTNWQLNQDSLSIFEKEIQVQNYVMPNLKMSLNFLKDAYGAKDKVSAELELMTNENTVLSDYQISYVVNIDGEEYLSKKDKTNVDGKTTIKFELPDNLETTDGLLNVMIDYQGKTESISRSIPIVLNNISLEFFPEGGDMIANAKTKIAFRATNEFEKSADVEGEIYNNDNELVCTFASYHKGMGAFDFIPEKNQNYYAKITKPSGIEKTYKLPEILKTGFGLRIESQNDNELILNIFSNTNENISIIAQTRGKIYSAETYKVTIGNNIISIPTKHFVSGVSQITLFNQNDIPEAERLVFVNKNN